ncbi:MAG TPA: TerC family protein [Anaeromyxobacteraceae bacterium]|nr:TerC family protein [Anaeromyxobacteraceae bacterium]
MWTGFLAFVLGMLALDLGVFNRRDHVIGTREAIGWSLMWIGLALAFGAGVFLLVGHGEGQEFVTAWVVEKSLSVDNLFVFVVLFEALRIPREMQHRVLFWGILSALVFRAAMILGGTALLSRFHWLTYVFGAFLVWTGWKLWAQEGDPGAGGVRILERVRRILPTTRGLHGHAFFAREDGRWHATPLFLALVAIEIADVAFAVDSIPAVFAVSDDPFIIFTSNIFAILGLRSLYFLLADMVGRFVYLRTGLSAVLVYVGVKMIAVRFVDVPAGVSLAIVLAILGLAVGASWLAVRRSHPQEPGPDDDLNPPP